MQFSLSAVVLAFSTLAAAMPTENLSNGVQAQHGGPPGHGGHGNIKWPIPDGMTVKEGQSKCGDQAQLSCCNKATYAGDTTDVNSGLGGGVLSNLIGTGSGAAGAGIFDQCSKLDTQSKLHQRQAIDRILTSAQSTSLLPSPCRTSSTRSASRTSPAVRTLLPTLYVFPLQQFCMQ